MGIAPVEAVAFGLFEMGYTTNRFIDKEVTEETVKKYREEAARHWDQLPMPEKRSGLQTAREVLRRADPCLANANPGEPIFVLRGQDQIAPAAVRFWSGLMHRETCGGAHTTVDCPLPKVQEALKLADEMERWPTRKLPD